MTRSRFRIAFLKHSAYFALFLGLCILLSGCGSMASNGASSSSFVTTGSMGFPHVGHTATLLNTGDVLIEGGAWGLGIDPNKLDPNGNPLTVTVPDPGCELYNSSSGVFSACPNLDTPIYYHTATLLQNGKVLIAGGYQLKAGIPPASFLYQQTAEVFDPALGFTTTGGLNTPRVGHTATLLNSGMVLIVGGQDAGGNALVNAELYDPATGTFTISGSLNAPRANHTATLLNNGTVLITGGWAPGPPNSNSNILPSGAELYDPATGAFTVTGSLNTAREAHTATLLNNGKVLVAGGADVNGNILDTAELYDPGTGIFTNTGSLNMQRVDHTSTLLKNGEVLIAGGHESNSNALNSAEIYDASTGQFTAIPSSLNTARFQHTATLLDSGKVFLTGGYTTTPGSIGLKMLSSTELY
jgi:hypothetical protein